MFGWIKDKAGEMGGRWYLNYHYGRYGTMTELKIDHERKTIEATVMLKGEQEPIQIRLSQYVFQTQGEGGTFTVGEVIVSREWMNVLANEVLKDKPLPLPGSIVKWLKLVL